MLTYPQLNKGWGFLFKIILLLILHEMIKVVNKHKHTPTENDVYIGRGSVLGNPYSSLKIIENTKASFRTSSREESVMLYESYLFDKIRRKDIAVCAMLNFIYLKALSGDVNLVCFCAPLKCHGEVIKNLIEEKLK